MVSQQYWGKGDHWHKGLCSERICERVQWLQANAFDFIQEQWKAQRIRKWYLFKLSIENLLIEKNTEDPFTFLNFSLRNEKSLGRRMWWLNFQFNEEYLGDVTGEYWRSQSVGKVFIKDPLSQGRQHLKYSHPVRMMTAVQAPFPNPASCTCAWNKWAPVMHLGTKSSPRLASSWPGWCLALALDGI